MVCTDELEYVIANTGTDKLVSTGIEILDLDVNATATLDLTSATGVKTIDVDVAGSKVLTVDKLLGTETIKWTAGANGASGITAVLADATGSSDSITLELNGSIADAADFTVADVETVNVKIATNAESIDLSGISMTAAADVATLKVTGDKALTVSALGADVTTIDASGMGIGGSFIQTGRSSTVVQTATGSAGDDTFIWSTRATSFSWCWYW